MEVATILSFVQLAIKAAPYAKEVYEDGKKVIQSLFNQGLISKETQDAQMEWADAHMKAALELPTPPELTVEP
jgi:hypothetical protein